MLRIIPARDDGGLGGKVLLVYETIKIYSEKFITNNSENNLKLSYTPKHSNSLLYVQDARAITSITATPDKNFMKIGNHPPEKKKQNRNT